MVIEESEINRIRFEDLSPSLQSKINEIIDYNDQAFVSLRTSLSKISNEIDTSTVIYAGTQHPEEISVGKTVYFDTDDNTVKIADVNGEWIYLN